jgi:CheY-like chemotaxis protein
MTALYLVQGVGLPLGVGCLMFGRPWQLIAEQTTATITSGWNIAGITALIGTLGASIIIPIIREWKTRERLAASEAREVKRDVEIDGLKDRITELEEAKDLVEREKDRRETELLESLKDLTLSNNGLTMRVTEMAHTMMVAEGMVSAEAQPPARLVLSDTEPDRKGPRVLIVEDNRRAREGCKEILRSAGCAVETAATFDAGMEAMTRDPEVMILDLMLPGGDGEDLLALAGARHPNMKVIVTTGRTEEYLGRVIALKPFKVLIKPVDYEGDNGLIAAVFAARLQPKEAGL